MSFISRKTDVNSSCSTWKLKLSYQLNSLSLCLFNQFMSHFGIPGNHLPIAERFCSVSHRNYRYDNSKARATYRGTQILTSYMGTNAASAFSLATAFCSHIMTPTRGSCKVLQLPHGTLSHHYLVTSKKSSNDFLYITWKYQLPGCYF